MIKNILLLISVLFIASCSNTGQLVGDFNSDGEQDILPEIIDLNINQVNGNYIVLDFELSGGEDLIRELNCRVNFGDGSPVKHFDCSTLNTLNHTYLGNTNSYNTRIFVSNNYTTVSSMVKYYTNQQVSIPDVYSFNSSEFNNSNMNLTAVEFTLAMSNPEKYTCKMTFGDGGSSPESVCSSGLIFSHTYNNNQEYTAVLIIKYGNKVVYKGFEKVLINY